MALISEQAVLLGARRSLIGVMTLPDAAGAGADLPAFVFLNSGIVHRVGPNRMTVTLARALAAVGYTVLRFDLSGIGDSDARPESLTPLEAGLADIREALDTLQAQRRTRRVILAGLCSGADFSLLYAGTDPRVVGLVLLDSSIPRTSRFYVQHYATRLLRMRVWKNVVTGRHPVWKVMRERASRTAPEQTEPASLTLQTQAVRQLFENAYASAVSNSIQIYSLFTAGIENQHNYRRQLLDAFPGVPFGDLLRLEYFSDTDHMFTAESARARLIKRVLLWAENTSFGTGGG